MSRVNIISGSCEIESDWVKLGLFWSNSGHIVRSGLVLFQSEQIPFQLGQVRVESYWVRFGLSRDRIRFELGHVEVKPGQIGSSWVKSKLLGQVKFINYGISKIKKSNWARFGSGRDRIWFLLGQVRVKPGSGSGEIGST